MTESTLAKKLLPKPGYRVTLINAPPEYIDQLGVKAEMSLTGKTSASLDFIQIFVKNLKELEELVPSAKAALKYDGLLWVSYPKGSSKVKTDLNRDIIWKAMGKFGLAAVSLVSIDNVWSAMRLRPAEKVGR